MPNKYFSIEGVATFIHHTGPTTLPDTVPDLSRGEVVLCLHSAGGNGNHFSGVLPLLALEHSPVAFDQPAHGRSGELDSLPSIERIAQFTGGVIERLGIERPVLLGHSLGGAVAMRYALDHPGGVRALILCSTAATFHVGETQIDELRRIAEGKARRSFNRRAYSPSTKPEVLRQGFLEDLKTDPRARLGDVLAAKEWNAQDRLAEISAPTLIVRGKDELEELAKESDRLAEQIPGARRVVIPKAGHVLPLEQPEGLAQAVVAFLTELPQ